MLIGFCGVLGFTSRMDAADLNWMSLTTITTGTAGSASGTLNYGPGPTVMVTYTGDVHTASQTDASGTNYWVQPATYSYSSGNLTINPPPGVGIITSLGGTATTYTITFSQPVINPVLAIASLGNSAGGGSRDYNFDQPFTLLKAGTGFFSPSDATTLTHPSGNVLRGNEGNGLIQFTGTLSTISWTNPVAETWSGFTVGVAPVPEPSTAMILLASITGLVGIRLRRLRNPGEPAT